MALSVLRYRRVNITLCSTISYSYLHLQFYSAICQVTTQATTYMVSSHLLYRPLSSILSQIHPISANYTTGIDRGLGISNPWRLVAQSATFLTIQICILRPMAPASSCSRTSMGKLRPIPSTIMVPNHVHVAFSWAWTTKSCEYYFNALVHLLTPQIVIC